MVRWFWVGLVLVLVTGATRAAEGKFQAGAAAVDVTPEKFPVVVNCGFLENVGKAARDQLYARALVLDDGTTRLAIVLVDNCMMPREFLDRVKVLISGEMKIPTSRLMIAATHTHTAPAMMGCLGSDPDPNYAPFLERRLLQAVREAVAALKPAQAGWAVVDAGAFTNNRQWILRSDRVRNDPFGKPTVRSNMHPGYLHPDFVGPSGPTDPWLSVFSVRTADDKPLAALVNFSMHYYGSSPVSADYFGLVCRNLEKRIRAKQAETNFVAIMSQGTAGDLHWMDYGKPAVKQTLDEYASAVTDRAEAALAQVKYRTDVPLAMAETTLTLGRRTPDAERLSWAKKLMAGLDGKKPSNQPEVYAREAILLHEEPRRELKIQAIRIGELGIVGLPNEVFALTGLKLRAFSPLNPTFTIELANGADGYIPPLEQHTLGGYTTWPARTAGLEIAAEARITETALSLLEQVAGAKRRALPEPQREPYAAQVLQSKPLGYWRLGDLAGPTVVNLIGDAKGECEPGVVFALNGPLPKQFAGLALVNRAVHLAGGRIRLPLPEVKDAVSVECWVWNGYPTDAREWTGTILSFARGDTAGDLLAIGGKSGTAGALATLRGAGDREPALGKQALSARTWNHVAWIREGNRVQVYLNGEREIDQQMPREAVPNVLWLGGRADKSHPLEGRLSEAALYDRALTTDEIRARVRAGKPE